ncbi:MAG: hypothetical protein ACLTG4_02480 [Oscillospiraceae bacterium]
MQAHGLRKRLLHTGSRAALLPVTEDADSVLALLVCARTMQLLAARGTMSSPSRSRGDRRVPRLCKAGVSVRPNADLAGLATHAAPCSPRRTSRRRCWARPSARRMPRRQRRRAAHAALAHRGGSRARRGTLRAELRAARAGCRLCRRSVRADGLRFYISSAAARTRGASCGGARRLGDAATDADVLRAMAALTRCLFRRPAALPAHVTLGSSAQALRWPPDAAGSLWGDEIDALRRELP